MAPHIFVHSYLYEWAFLVSFESKNSLYFRHTNQVRKANNLTYIKKKLIVRHYERDLFVTHKKLRASSHAPGWPGWPGLRNLALPPNPMQKFRCVHMRGWADLVPENSVFPTGISGKGLDILPYEHMNKAGWILAILMASSCIACCILHIISIPFNCSDKL